VGLCLSKKENNYFGFGADNDIEYTGGRDGLIDP
jgi:hypothetical protein